MSANNYILIKKNRRKGVFEVTHRNFDTEAVLDEIGYSKDLEKAVKKANHFISKEIMILEYGLWIIF